MNLIPTMPSPTWTTARLRRHFGMIPAERILLKPAPGTATEKDVLFMDVHRDRICELVDGVLVEKAMASSESLVAADLIFFLKLHQRNYNIGGAILGEGGLLRLCPGLVRAPDVSFISKDQFPGGRFPMDPIASLVPDLAVEVISKSNTKQEMERKLGEYFETGTRLVWLVRPKTRTVDVYTAVEQIRRLRGKQILDGGDVLPDFTLPLTELFASV
jgi:Uma2 family endonuclease